MVLGESISFLWSSLFDDQTALVAGKVQNLRVAAARLNGLTVAAGSTFSFWRTLGRPSRRLGYVQGRELREGCMISSIGGGLCQLSNALYSAALDAGMEILERHPHSQVVPGSLAETGRDATVFWNYIDLRFRSHRAYVIEARLTDDQLIVRFRGDVRDEISRSVESPSLRSPLPVALIKGDPPPDDCGECGQRDCVQNFDAGTRSRRTAYLLDEVWPEFDEWISTRLNAGDHALVPMDGVRRGRAGYAWSSVRDKRVRLIEHRWLSLRRSLASRRLKAQGAERQRKLLAFDGKFAAAYAPQIPYDTEHVVVPIGMLVELWRLGALGGRKYTVLMTRAPIMMLQRDLDRAASLHPDSPTLGDFRADKDLVALEELALKNSHAVVTPHRAVAAFVAERYGKKPTLLDWVIPESKASQSPGKQVLFPASALGRKGAFEIRDACRELGLGIRILGKSSEWDGFWEGLNAVSADPAAMFEDIGCVVLPAFVEHRPRVLLKALAAGIPVICSPQCGIPEGMPGVTIVPVGDSRVLAAALKARDDQLSEAHTKHIF